MLYILCIIFLWLFLLKRFALYKLPQSSKKRELPRLNAPGIQKLYGVLPESLEIARAPSPAFLRNAPGFYLI
jgi:hypothetical protein